MISQSEVVAARRVFLNVQGMLGKRYIPWLWTQGQRDRVRERDGPAIRLSARMAEMRGDLR